MHESDPKVHLAHSGEPYKIGSDLKPGERVKVIEWVPGNPKDLVRRYEVVRADATRVVLKDGSGRETVDDARRGYLLDGVIG